MITHHDLFSGNLGKLKHVGGSRCYATPNTAIINSQYSITVNYNIQGNLVAHSLDGRLWLYRRSRRLGIIALKWNKQSAKLEYAAAKNLSNNDDVVLACGFDWVLTNNNIFMVSDEEPYILSSNLFDANSPDTFLYSILRSGSYEKAGIDPFTNSAWGKRQDNGNSEGNGCFSKNSHLLYPAGTHTFEQCYSLLPSVGDWQIFENFLIRRPNANNLDSHNYMHSLRPLIPLEFAFAKNRLYQAKYGTAIGPTNNGFKDIHPSAYGTGYNLDHRGIQLAHIDGKLWGRGLYNIGRVSILPAVFDENGEVLEFYLYIGPDFPCSTFLKEAFDVHHNWLNTSIAVSSDNSPYGFLTQSNDNRSGSACIHVSEPKLFLPRSNEWKDYSANNGKLFVDALSSSGIVLHDKGLTFLINEPVDLECPNLSQWVAPAGKVEAVNDHYVAASSRDSFFVTSRPTGFNRFYFTSGSMSLTASGFLDDKQFAHRLCLSEGANSNSRKVFSVSSFVAGDYVKPISWDSVYKNAVNIKLLHSFAHKLYDIVRLTSVVGDDNQCSLPSDHDFYKCISPFPIFVIEQSVEAHAVHSVDEGYNTTECIVDRSLSEGDTYTFARRGSFTDFPIQFAVPTLAKASAFLIDPDTGIPSEPLNLDIECDYRLNTINETITVHGWRDGGEYWRKVDRTYTYVSYIEIPQQVVACDGKLGWVMEAVDHSEWLTYSSAPKKYIFKPVTDIPRNIIHWFNKDYNLPYNSETNIIFYFYEQNESIAPQLSLSKFPRLDYPLFNDNISLVAFSLHIESDKHLQLLQDFTQPYRAFDYPYVQSYRKAHDNVLYSDKNLHVAIFRGDAANEAAFLVFRSQVFNDTFDFNSEFERSKLS